MSAYILSVSILEDDLVRIEKVQQSQIYWLVDGETHIESTGSYIKWAEMFETRAEAAAFMYSINEGWK